MKCLHISGVLNQFQNCLIKCTTLILFSKFLRPLSAKRHHIQNLDLQSPVSAFTNICTHPHFLHSISQNTIFAHALKLLSLNHVKCINIYLLHFPGQVFFYLSHHRSLSFTTDFIQKACSSNATVTKKST